MRLAAANAGWRGWPPLIGAQVRAMEVRLALIAWLDRPGLAISKSCRGTARVLKADLGGDAFEANVGGKFMADLRCSRAGN